MADYPDWSRLVQLIGSDIKVPIDVQGQFITLDINILSTTADIDVNINASTIELDIDITAQHIGMYLVPDWYAKEGLDKNFYAHSGPVAFGGTATVTRLVPAGKTLYITDVAFSIYPAAAADYDHFIYFSGSARISLDATNFAFTGGIGGGQLIFNKPLVIEAGKTFEAQIVSRANVNTHVIVTARGYEI